MPVIAMIAGALFGAGVCLSGMVRPTKVLAFLDVRDAWDPTLMVVFAAALAVVAVAWRVVARLDKPRVGAAFPPLPGQVIDARLIGGSVVFGVGWGLVGYCPGPAIVSLVSGATSSLVFVGGMVAGVLLMRPTREDG
jgi:uncharacterized membrane protein YedE/YeeE